MKKMNLLYVVFAIICMVVISVSCGVQEPVEQDPVLQYLGSDYSFEKSGSITYIVKDSVRIGGGYHSYFVKDGWVYGQFGAMEEVVISSSGQINNFGGHSAIERNRAYIAQAVLDHLGPDYSYDKHGSIKYLLKDSVRIGGGYHSYFLKDGAVYGLLGSMKESVIDEFGRVNNDGGASAYEKVEAATAQVVLDHLGSKYSYDKHGSMTYILNDGERISRGHHAYFVKDGKVYGKLGASTYLIMDELGNLCYKEM